MNMTKYLPSFPMLYQPEFKFKGVKLTLCLACIVYNMYVESSRCIKPLATEEKMIRQPAMIISFIL